MQQVITGGNPKDRECVAQYYVTDRVGRFICSFGSQDAVKDEEDGLRFIRWLVKNDVYFRIGGMVWPEFDESGELQMKSVFSKELAEKIKQAAGKHLLMIFTLTEFGSLVYWPRDYLMFDDGLLSANKQNYGSFDPKTLLKNRLCGAKDLVEAKERFLRIVRDVGCFHKEYWGDDVPICSVESSTMEKYCFEAGCGFSSHEILPSDPILELTTSRSVTRAYGKDCFAAHIAIGCYGGWREDRLKNMRWRMALKLSYLAGAGIIYEEGGHYKEPRHNYAELSAKKINMQWDLPEYHFYRDEMIQFNDFVKKDQRPEGFPMTPVGLLHGHLDGWCGMWDNRVWGQFHSPEWQYNDAEHGWEYFSSFFKKLDWGENEYYGEQNLTGNPPCGQMDLVPMESSTENWRNYNCLLMLGWNTMTDENYAKLLDWVKQGGHLIAAVPHTRTDIRRVEELTLFNGGDFSDLFGVKVKGPSEDFSCGVRFLHDPDISGYFLPTFNNFERFTDPACICGPIPLADVELAGARVLACRSHGADAIEEQPILVEHKVGKGTTLFLTTWCYPGKREMAGVMRALINAVINGEQVGPQFVGSDQIRFSIYREGDGYRCYFLNTDFDVPSCGRMTYGGRTWELVIQPAEMKVYTIN